ncbi:MAG: cytochrome c biogenesis protein CcsA [Candidatus Azosocius agrarius]|nr:MAG: cytochrome c biogenesis protein CcsA [Gammaproteobacteria bacterium]
MYKIILKIIIINIILSISYVNATINTNNLKKIPIFHEGRIKPLDTFSKISLINIHKNYTYKHLNSTTWFSKIIFNPYEAYKDDIFFINNDLIKLLKLSKKNFYSFFEIFEILNKNIIQINKLYKINPEKLNKLQKKLLNLHKKILIYLNISQSLSMITYKININESLLKILNLKNKKYFCYIDILKKKDILSDILKKISKKQLLNINEIEKNILKISNELYFLSKEKKKNILKIIPPINNKILWYSPWEIINNKNFTNNIEYLTLLKKLTNAYNHDNQTKWDKTFNNLYKLIYKKTSNKLKYKIYLEIIYNKINLLNILIFIYITILLFLSLKIMIKKNIFDIYIKILYYINIIIYCFIIIVRIYITNRPPVTTLYESLIFVGFITTFSIYFSKLKKIYINILLISIINILILYISNKYENYIDNIKVVSAVLNTNFWLSTHVITITIGYSFCIFTSFLAHYHLLEIYKNKKLSNDTLKNIMDILIISLFFSFTGTILGGIWADQSWGRFWGWDPKENGALLINLWILLLIHGKISNILSNISFLIGICLLNTITIIAWFGINFLNTGLHTYGFIKNLELNIIIFIIIDILYIFIITSFIKHKLK